MRMKKKIAPVRGREKSPLSPGVFFFFWKFQRERKKDHPLEGDEKNLVKGRQNKTTPPPDKTSYPLEI